MDAIGQQKTKRETVVYNTHFECVEYGKNRQAMRGSS